ncbi:N-acetylglucosamine kinase [Vibrio gazogenes]|uniref:N-acetylglucosamine kinase n=1 Tax=Vibrio gazogenes DSM 21264 = NBRC 103151 TaxID=1123492 RepID=A0A1M4ZHZ4_VIBGA|nr:N-acetylglucosamine kinase [Vibrio gazogenes]USP12398.1 N-acetylglucosamine kinase [Vibrio gazogenes]SHF17664.1 N-acetylglucosamine kinase [Vibrio gazogenes DSM 21264] [Vibrio gazogenes DSM 21264 = NBRC 103151]
MYYGFDVGGTKIEFGAFDTTLTRVATERLPTPLKNYDQFINVIAEQVEKYDVILGCVGQIGVGLPGMERVDDGTLLTANIPSVNGRHLRHDLEERLQRPVRIENDANCFILSEAWDDSLRDSPSVMGLILGTGFGGGLVYRGEIFSGRNHIAGEVGHMRIPIDAWFWLGDNPPLFQCGCGQQGCLENYISGRGFEALYQHRYGQFKPAVEIIENFYAGDKTASDFIDFFIELLAICLGNIFTAHDPHTVVLGGGLSNFERLYQELPQRISRYLLPIAQCPEIRRAKYGATGGVRGAAFLNLQP